MKVRDLTVSELLKYEYNDGLQFDIVIRDQYGRLVPLDMEVAKHINTKFTLRCGVCSRCPINEYCNHVVSDALIYDRLLDTFDRLEKVMDVSLKKKSCILDLIRLERRYNSATKI